MSEMTLFKGGLPAYLQGSDDATNALAGIGAVFSRRSF